MIGTSVTGFGAMMRLGRPRLEVTLVTC